MPDRQPKTHTCPPEICALFQGDETALRKARVAAMDWLKIQPVRKGDRVEIPDPMSGSLKLFVAEHDLIWR